MLRSTPSAATSESARSKAARSATALETKQLPHTSLSSVRRERWNGSTNLASKRVNTRSPDETKVKADARAAAALDRRQRLAKLAPSRPVVHATPWNGSTNLASKRVNKRSPDHAKVKDDARAAASVERQQRLASLSTSRPFKPVAEWNSSTNVASKRVNKPSPDHAKVKADARAAAALDRRQRLANLSTSRPHVHVFEWNGSTNIASKRVNLPIQRPAPTRGGAVRPTLEESNPAPQPAAQPWSDAKSHQLKWHPPCPPPANALAPRAA